jgi:hypothetical protein
VAVTGRETVIVEGYVVDDGDEEQGPMGAAFGNGGVAAVGDWEEDMGDIFEGGKGRGDGMGVGGLEEHEGHGGAEEDDVGVFVVGEVEALKVSRRVSSGIWECG